MDDQIAPKAEDGGRRHGDHRNTHEEHQGEPMLPVAEGGSARMPKDQTEQQQCHGYCKRIGQPAQEPRIEREQAALDQARDRGIPGVPGLKERAGTAAKAHRRSGWRAGR